jgi:hypothetical protein
VILWLIRRWRRLQIIRRRYKPARLIEIYGIHAMGHGMPVEAFEGPSDNLDSLLEIYMERYPGCCRVIMDIQVTPIRIPFDGDNYPG